MKQTNYLSDEIIFRTSPEINGEHLPHYIDLKHQRKNKKSKFGNPQIDAILKPYKKQIKSISRIFVPKKVTKKLGDKNPISGSYSKKEIKKGIACTYKLKLKNSEIDILEICSKLNDLSIIIWARPNYIIRTQSRFGEPYMEREYNRYFQDGLWGLDRTTCKQAWKIERGIPEVKIAVIDTGIDLKNPLFKNRIKHAFDFVDVQTSLGDPFTNLRLGDSDTPDDDPTDIAGHGTAVTAIAAGAQMENGFSGVCPEATIIPLRSFYTIKNILSGNQFNYSSSADINASIYHAMNHKADIINMSFGEYVDAYSDLIKDAYTQNICLFAASGNQGSTAGSYPASNLEVMAVASVDYKNKRVHNSNYGPAYNAYVMAPGKNVLTCYLNEKYYHSLGTSIATPFVAGLAGLMLSLAKRKGKNLRVAEVYDIIRLTAELPEGKFKGDPEFAQGIINMEAALKETARRFGLA